MKLSSTKILKTLTIFALVTVFATTVSEVQAAAPKVQGRVIDSTSMIGLEDVYIRWTGEEGEWRYAPSDSNGYYLFYGWSEYHELANSWPCSGGMLMSQGDCGGNVWYGSKCSDGTSLTKATCTAGGGDWLSFVCSDGTSVTEAECSGNGGFWYGDWGVSADCNSFGWMLRDAGGDRIIQYLESMLTVSPDWVSSSNKTYATCPPPAGSPGNCGGEPCVCPNNIPASYTTNCYDPGPPETFGFNFNPRGDFGCNTSHVLEPVLPDGWYGSFFPESITFFFPGMSNGPDLINAGLFLYTKAVCGDGTVQAPNDDGEIEECDDGNTIDGDGCSATCQSNSCNFSLSTVTINGEGGTGNGIVTITAENGGLIDYVTFGIPSPPSTSNSVARIIGSATDTTRGDGFSVQIESLVNAGNTTYAAIATMDDGTTTCPAIGPVTGTINISALAWWQVDGADVMTNGSIGSEIPSSCVSPCDPYILTGIPAVPVAADPSPIDYGGGVGASSSDWEVGGTASTRYVGERYDYDFFASGFPSGTPITDPDVTAATFASCPEDGSYCYYYYDGGLGPIDVPDDAAIDLEGKKVVLLVENTDVNIEGNIEFDDGIGIFIVVSDQDITIEGTVDHLEGIYIADDYIYTCSGCSGDDDQLEVDGIFIAWRQVILQRDLGEIENPNTPGELFRSSPEQVLLIPQLLSKRDVKWLEVQP